MNPIMARFRKLENMIKLGQPYDKRVFRDIMKNIVKLEQVWLQSKSKQEYRKLLADPYLTDRQQIFILYIRLYTNLILAINELMVNGARASQYVRQVVNYSRKLPETASEISLSNVEKRYLNKINALSKEILSELLKVENLRALGNERKHHLKGRLMIAENICVLRLLNL